MVSQRSREPKGRSAEGVSGRRVAIVPALLEAAGAGDDPRHADLEGRDLFPALAEGAELGPVIEVFAERSSRDEPPGRSGSETRSRFARSRAEESVQAEDDRGGDEGDASGLGYTGEPRETASALTRYWTYPSARSRSSVC
jgi:hypothetical protein